MKYKCMTCGEIYDENNTPTLESSGVKGDGCCSVGSLIELKSNIKLDCTKIISLEEVKLILDGLDLYMEPDCLYYEQLIHLERDDTKKSKDTNNSI